MFFIVIGKGDELIILLKWVSEMQELLIYLKTFFLLIKSPANAEPFYSTGNSGRLILYFVPESASRKETNAFFSSFVSFNGFKRGSVTG